MRLLMHIRAPRRSQPPPAPAAALPLASGRVPLKETAAPDIYQPASSSKALLLVQVPAATHEPPPTMKLHHVSVPGFAAPLMLPATGANAADSLAHYVDKLGQSRMFAADEMRALRHLETAPAALDATRPQVGVFIHEPSSLASEETRHIVEALEAMGCQPVLIPPGADVVLPSQGAQRADGIRAMLAPLDGLFGPGGDDVHPKVYQAQITFSHNPNYQRDRFQADVALTAMQSDLFMFGVCRSHQLWNAAAGGKLAQDVRKEGLSSLSQNQEDFGIDEDKPFVVKRAGKVVFENRVEVTQGSLLSGALDERSSVLTNSYHHQAVTRVGHGLRATGSVTDPANGRATIEATEGWNSLTTQWHPELMSSSDPAERKLLETLGRRAHVFFMLHRLQDGGAPVHAEDVVRQMKASGRTFDDSDVAWVRDVLSQRLARE